MADALTVQFVSAPDPTATLRYDFFTKSASFKSHVLNEGGLNLGSPAWSGDPQGVGGRYDYRQMNFTQRIEGTKAVALGRLSALAKELQRDTNWLKIQFASNLTAYYYKTYKTDPGEMRLEYVEASQAWDITVPLVADAFAYGARVTQSPATIGSSLGAANPMRLALPAIKGDAPTKLRITLTQTTGEIRATRLALVSADAAVVDPVFDIGTGDGFSAGAGTAAGTSNAAALGGSWRVVTIGTGANLLTRLSGTITPAAAGRYKVLVRCEADPVNSAVPNRYGFSFGQVSDVTPIFTPAVIVDTPATNTIGVADTFRGWVDLGDFTFPRGVNAPIDVTGSQPASGWALAIGTPAGVAGTVRLDAIKLVPIDGNTIRSTTFLRTTPTDTALYMSASATGATNWDGDTETLWQHTVSTGALLGDRPAYAQTGAYLAADPGATQNLLITLLDGNASSATGVWTVVVSYLPRYLHVGDGT